MPLATDLSLANNAGVVKNFALIVPAGGSGTPALWQLKEGAIQSIFPSFEASMRPNASKTARKAIFTMKVPSSYTAAVTGLTAVGSAATINMTVTVPHDFPEALKDDFVAYWSKFNSDVLIKKLIRDAVAAT